MGYQPKPKRPVSVGWRLRQLIAAEVFGQMPHQWDVAPIKSQAEAMAYVEVKGLMTEYRMEPDEG